jgi:hypothetical protein
VADLGFEHLRFKNIPLIWDDQVPSGTVYFLGEEGSDRRLLN